LREDRGGYLPCKREKFITVENTLKVFIGEGEGKDVHLLADGK